MRLPPGEALGSIAARFPMKNLRLISASILIASLAAVAPALHADTASPAAPAPAKAETSTPLEIQMHRIGKSVKALKKLIGDPTKNAASLQLVAVIRDAANTSLTLVPKKAADLSGPARDKFVADYQAGMKQFIAGVDKLSEALAAGDNAAALKDLRDLFGIEKQDHKLFRKPEDR